MTLNSKTQFHSKTVYLCLCKPLSQELDFSSADCPPLASPSNGVIHGNINTHGSWARLECDATSLPLGGFTRSRCDAGIWTPALACIGLHLIDSNTCISASNNQFNMISNNSYNVVLISKDVQVDFNMFSVHITEGFCSNIEGFQKIIKYHFFSGVSCPVPWNVSGNSAYCYSNITASNTDAQVYERLVKLKNYNNNNGDFIEVHSIVRSSYFGRVLTCKQIFSMYT